MHRKAAVASVATCLLLAWVSPAAAQRLPFERTLDAAQTLDISTIRGQIDIAVGDPGRIVVEGTVTVRASWDTPADALDRARRIAAAPPIEEQGGTLRLREPADDTDRRAVTVAYQVRVPRDTRVVAHSESGAIAIDGVGGTMRVQTQSSSIRLARLGGDVEVTTGSGSVVVDGSDGDVRVQTSSSAIMVKGLRAAFHARTQSGQIDAVLTGSGAVDVQTGSSAIHLQGVAGALTAATESGRVLLFGRPGADWDVVTGSGSVELRLRPDPALTLDATTRSGSVRIEDVVFSGAKADRSMQGTIGAGGAGGPLVRLASRSGSIKIKG